MDSLNIASFERVKYKGAARERPGTLLRQHREQNSALDSAVKQARERVEDNNPVMFTLPGSHVAAGKQILVLEALQFGAPEVIPPRLADGGADAGSASRAKRLRENNAAENAGRTGGTNIRALSAIGYGCLVGSAPDTVGFVSVGDSAFARRGNAIG